MQSPAATISADVLSRCASYTFGMKTAISVPDDVFNRAERLARTAGKSRSEVYSAALREYVARHEPDEVTEAINRAIEDLGEDAAPDEFLRAAAKRVLDASEW